MRKKVGVLGGTFDPIHFGHINLALSLKEQAGLDEVLFVPARASPHKMHAPPHASFAQRVEMLKRALQSIPNCFIYEGEGERPAPSYTIDTLNELTTTRPAEYYLLLAQDAFVHFSTWKQSQNILQLCKLLVGCRSPQDSSCITIPCLEISSTVIRQRLQQGLYCGHFVPESVLQYIQGTSLYKSVNG